MFRVLIVAAYPSTRAGLHALLAGVEECAVIGEASGSEELERILPEARPDVLIADVAEPDTAAILDIASASEAGLVLLGEDLDGYRALADLPLRGWAYLLKEADGEEIGAAVRAVARGLVVLDRSVGQRLRIEAVPAPPGPRGDEASTVEMLTAREREVLQLLADGLPNKTIAARLGITPNTAKFHVASVLAKLGAASRAEAVAIGARRGLLML